MAQISAKTCQLCTEKRGVFYCYECQHALCEFCQPKHDKIPSTKGHTVTSIQKVDLANFNSRSQCNSHERDFLLYCTKCGVLICRDCLFTTHKNHSYSDIAEVVSKERERSTDTLLQLKAKIENIIVVKENVRCNHLDKLGIDSKNVVDDIESICQELMGFVQTVRNIRITETEDAAKLERQNIESFLQNVGHVHKQYSRVSAELKNILLEEHDITFFMCNSTLQGNLKNLDNVPDFPKFEQIEPFEKRLFYTDTVAFIQSKAGDSICQYCADKQLTIDGIQKEQKACDEKLNRAVRNLQKGYDELKTFKQKIETLENRNRDMEMKAMEKDKEVSMLNQKINTLETRVKEMESIEAIYISGTSNRTKVNHSRVEASVTSDRPPSSSDNGTREDLNWRTQRNRKKAEKKKRSKEEERMNKLRT